MRTRAAALSVCIAICVAVFSLAKHNSHAQQNENAADANRNQPTARQADVAHGMYIVHHVAMCIYCHTPRDERGVPDQQLLLQGAPMPVESPFAGQQWAFQAPKIAGLPGGWTEDELVRFLQTGTTPTGHKPQLPMPPFRLTEDDARGVAAYLKSLQ